MKILITGSRGFIGSHAVSFWQKMDAHDVYTYEWDDRTLPRIEGLDWVFHFGAISSTTERDVAKVMRQNYDFSVWLYEECRKHDVNLQSRAANISCPLYIPFGFFENNIKLRIGYENVITDCININLNKNNYTVIDNNGTDLKCFQNEIPYFWKKRISETYINPK
jgi:hypothetical protein